MNIGPAPVQSATIDGLTRRRLERDAQMAADVRTRIETAVTIHGITAVLKALATHSKEFGEFLKGRGDTSGSAAWSDIYVRLDGAYLVANEHLTD